jgi:P27 family predicted phage terminase small subunit
VGQRGPVGKPAELKVLEGNRGNRSIDLTAMFRPEVGVPPMPRDLSRDGKKAWKRLVPELVKYNLLSTVDADALETLCETIGMLKVLRRSINASMERLLADGKDPAEAIEASTPNGMKVQSVAYQAMNREREKLRIYLAEFGLTPAQRARVTTAIRAQMPLFDVNKGAAPGAAPRPNPADALGFADF